MSVRLVECTLQTGSVETQYVRAGQGEPVILLTLDTFSALDTNPLFQRLCSDFRVFVPAIAESVCENTDRFGKWLRDFVEGLGLNEPHIIVEGAAVPLVTG